MSWRLSLNDTLYFYKTKTLGKVKPEKTRKPSVLKPEKTRKPSVLKPEKTRKPSVLKPEKTRKPSIQFFEEISFRVPLMSAESRQSVKIFV
jgi:hypothetical protein